MPNRNNNVLTGQHTLAQGKRRRSDALGWGMGKSFVRAIWIIYEKFVFRTKVVTAIPLQIRWLYSVRIKFFAMNIIFTRTVTSLFLLPRALPRAEIYWPFSPEKNTQYNRCESSS